MTNAQLRFLTALALERVGLLSPAGVREEAEKMLDELSAGDDPLSQLLQSTIARVPLTVVTPSRSTGATPNE